MPVESLEVPFPEAKVSALRLEYFATISYVDQQIGRLLDALDETGVADRTAVLFLGASLTILGDRGQYSPGLILPMRCCFVCCCVLYM